MYSCLITQYWWPGIHKDVERWVKGCVECQEAKALQKKADGRPGELVCMGLISELPLTAEGYQYTLVTINTFTCWLDVHPLKMKQAKEVAKALLEIFASMDLPKELLSDQGKEFVNKLNNELSTLLGIKHKYATAEHPQGNGMVE